VLVAAVIALTDELPVAYDPITNWAYPAFACPQLVAVHVLGGVDGVVSRLLLLRCSSVPDQPRSGHGGIVRHGVILSQNPFRPVLLLEQADGRFPVGYTELAQDRGHVTADCRR